MAILFSFWIINALTCHSSTALLVLPTTATAKAKAKRNRFRVVSAMSSDGYAQNNFRVNDNWDNQGPGPEYPDEERYFDEPAEQRGGFSENAFRQYNYNGQSEEEFMPRNGGGGYGYGRGREEPYGEHFGQKGYQQQYREDAEDGWEESQNYLDGGQGQQYGTRFGAQGQYGEDVGQRGFIGDERQETYVGKPRPPSSQQQYPPQYRPQYRNDIGSVSGGDRYEYQGRKKNYDEPQTPPEGENSFDRRRVYETREDFDQQSRRQPSQSEPLQKQQREQRREQLRQQLSTNPQDKPFRPRTIDRVMERRMNRPMGFGMMDEIVDPFMGPGMDRMMMNPFVGVDMMDRMLMIMDRFSTEIAANMNQNQEPKDGLLLGDAYNLIQSDDAVVEMLGEDIELGMPFARSESSGIIDGVTRTFIQLGIPIRGSKGTGRVKLAADEESITRIEVGTGPSTVIDVDIGNGRSSDSRAGDVGEKIINTNVVDWDNVE